MIEGIEIKLTGDVEPETPALEVAEGEGVVESAFDPDVQRKIDKDGAECIVNKLVRQWKKYKSWREDNVEPTWLAIIRAYEGYTRPNPEPYRHEYVIRECFRQIETLRPQLAEQFFNAAKNFRYKPRLPGTEDDIKAAENVVQDQIVHFEMQQELEKWLDDAPFFGVSYLEYGWRQYRELEHKPFSVHAEDGTSWWDRTTTEKEESAPRLRHLNVWGCYTHPYIEGVDKSPFFFYREMVTADYVKTLIRQGDLDVDACKEANIDGDRPFGGAGQALRMMEERDDDGAYEAALDADDEVVELLRCWSCDGWEYVIINQKFLVRGKRNKYGRIPVECLTNYRMVGKHYGYPELLIILDEQRLLNDVMGMYVDAQHIACSPMFVLPTDLKKEWNQVIWRPGGAIYTDNPSAVQQLQVTPLNVQLAQDAAYIQQNMRVETGITNELSGVGSDQKTATGVVRMQQAATARIRQKVRRFAPRFRNVYGTLYKLNAAFLEDEYALRLEGPNGEMAFKRYGPEVFEAPIDVEVELANEMESGVEAANKWQNAYKLFGQDPLVDRAYMIEKNLRALGERDWKRALVNPVLSQSDALRENQELLAFGTTDQPRAQDNHQAHIQIHQMLVTTPAFQAMAAQNPTILAALQRHLGTHMEYLQAMQSANAQAQQTPQADASAGMTGVQPEANARANAMFDMGQRGRDEMGVG